MSCCTLCKLMIQHRSAKALALSALLSAASGSLDFYMDAAQTERLYGVSTAKGIYYIKDGIVNQYAMTFQDQV